jgi:hypothetical protein
MADPSPTNATADLGMADVSAPQAPAFSYDEAVSRKDQILNDPQARDRLMQGDVEMTQTWRSIQQALAYGTPPKTATSRR